MSILLIIILVIMAGAVWKHFNEKDLEEENDEPSMSPWKKNFKGGWLLIILTIIIFMTLSSFGDKGKVKIEPSDNSSYSFMLASLDTGHTNPSQYLVEDFEDLLRNLKRKCPNESESNISDYIVTVRDKIIEKGINESLFQIGTAMDNSIPEEAIGTIKCAEVAATLIVMTGN